jgi:hypothetical protein
LRRLLTLLALLLCAAPAQAQFLNDDFTEGGGNVTLVAHTVTPGPGGTWVEHGSYADDCTISAATDYLQAPGGANFCINYNDASSVGANYRVVGAVYVESNAAATYPGVACRVDTGADTMYRVYYDQVDGRLELEEVNAGSVNQRGTHNLSTLTNSQTYSLELECVDDVIKVKWEAAEVVSYTDPSPITAAGKAAVMQYANSGQQLTSVTATDIGGGGGSTTRSLGLLGVGQ